MSVRKRSGLHRKPWQIVYRDGNGQRRSKQFALKKDADAWCLRLSSELLDGSHVPDRATVTVREAGNLWLQAATAAGLERGTCEAYAGHLRNHIIPLLGNVKLSALDVPRIRAFTDQLQRTGRTSVMRRKLLTSLGSLLSDAQERGLTSRNAVRDMKRLRRHPDETKRRKLQVGVDIPTPVEARQIIHAAPGKSRAVLLTTIFTGLRSSELRALRWTDIDLEGRNLHIRQRVDRYGKFGPPKSGAGTRSIPLAPIVVNTLREWKLACPRCDLGLAFPNSTGEIMSHTELVNYLYLPTLLGAGLVRELLDDAGKPLLRADGKRRYEGRYTGIHSLRHFYASWCINRVVDGGLELPAKRFKFGSDMPTSS